MKLLRVLMVVLSLCALAWGCGEKNASPVAPEVIQAAGLNLSWDDEFLRIHGSGYSISVHYIEAFVRSGSTDQAWGKSVVPHRTALVDKAGDGLPSEEL